MKKILLIICTVTFLIASSENISLINSIKTLIQKEEYIALAINKYIVQTGKLPKTSDNKLDWDKLIKDDTAGEYLSTKFDNTNPLNAATLAVIFDKDNNIQIKGLVSDSSKYEDNSKYLYDFYTNKLFRINTTPPKNSSEDELKKGSSIIYGDFQKEIVKIVTDGTYDIKSPYEGCTANNYFYELQNQKAVYRYCKADGSSFDVYQQTPIYLEDWNDLSHIKATVGDKAFVKKNGQWYEYEYQGDTEIPWVPVGSGNTPSGQDDSSNLGDNLLSYIPGAKDLVIRRDGGCMLANGDVYCWGNNDYKKAGISSYGQLDHGLSPDYVNTPVMLKVQLENDLTQNDKKWYNNPYRTKFEKMSMNSTNVCAISTIYDYTQGGVSKKYGGDLYCNGKIDSKGYEDMDTGVAKSSILKRNIFFATDKTDKLNNANEIYLTDIAMVEDTVAVLSEAGDIYTFGRNYKGTLGIDSTDKFFSQITPTIINNSSQNFKKIFALRDIKCFGAIDSDNQFWIWGERPNGTIYYKPTIVASNQKFNPDMIFINSSDFILKGVDNIYYRTKNDIDTIVSLNTIIPNSALSASIYDDSTGAEYYLYVDRNMQLQGSDDLLNCREADEISSCGESKSKIFDLAFKELNTISNVSNGKSYANFANAAIYKLDHVITEISDDFEDGTATEWSNSTVTTTVDDGTDYIPPTNFLGVFTVGNSATSRTFNFGSSYANYDVEVEFDFYEINSWDYEKFNLKLNDELIVSDNFVHDNHSHFVDTKDSGERLQAVIDGCNPNYGQDALRDYRYRYKLKSKLNSNGSIKVEFSSRLLQKEEVGGDYWLARGNGTTEGASQEICDESWGIDNIAIKVKETDKKFICTMTGLQNNSQMYCWGNIARSAPILNASLYDESKTSTINKLFITQEDEARTQMGYDEYFNEGKLFLKYPTYIGGFDYEFYFK